MAVQKEFSFHHSFGLQYHSDLFAFILEDVNQGNEIQIFISQSDAFADSEGYRLHTKKINSGLQIDIAYGTERGLVYALFAIRRACKHNRFLLGEIDEAPKFKVRGYIEGFYGRPWSKETRKAMLEYAVSYGANTHYYAPKDDPYHRKLWREEYPQKELLQLKELADTAAAYRMEFAYCIAPGLSICYASEAEFACLTQKITQLYDIGIRSFGLLLDDIAPELYYEEDKQKYNSTVEAHIDLINRTDSFLQALDNCTLTVCPTEYWGKGDSAYLCRLGQGIPAHIRMFFTGNDICSKEITSEEAAVFAKNTNRPPLYWDNYPVNDAEMFMEMHLGPLLGRSNDLWRHAEGEIFNCMEYAQCTKIPLATALTYLWAPQTYNPEQAYLQAVEENIPQEEREAFLLLADHLRTSCLKDENSHIMGEHLVRCLAALESGEPTAAKEIFTAYSTKMTAAAAVLKKRKDGIYNELRIWIEKFILCADILALGGEILFDKADKKEELKTKMQRYNRDATVLTAFCFREMVEYILQDFTY